MAIREDLDKKIKEAMKNHDEDAKRACRMLLSSIKFIEKEQGKTLGDEDILPIIQREIKIRKETLAEAVKGEREATIAEAQKDIEILESFLPKQLSEEALRKIVSETIVEVGAQKASDMGKVMKAVLPKVKGLAANDAISKIVKDMLQ